MVLAKVIRKRLSANTKLEILDRQKHECPLCFKSLSGATRIEFDHEIALGIGGADDPDNIVGVHAHCHKSKTAVDRKKIAKNKRLQGVHGQRARRRSGSTQKIPSRPFRW